MGKINVVNLSSFELKNFFKFFACVISAQKTKHLKVTTMLTYSHANTPLDQSERSYYLSYFIILYIPSFHGLRYVHVQPCRDHVFLFVD